MNEPLQRTLNLTIRLNENDFEVNVYEPETGETVQFQHQYSPDEHPEFDRDIGAEIYQSWRKAPAFRHGDISHTLFPRKDTFHCLH